MHGVRIVECLARFRWPISCLAGLALVVASSRRLPAQPPAQLEAPPLRVTIQDNGVALSLAEDNPSAPLFGELLGGQEASLQATLVNWGATGFLGVWFGSPRPLSTALELEHYCAAAGVRTNTGALCALLQADGASVAGQGPRQRIDRLAAVALLARDPAEAATKALREAAASDDRLLRLWAKHHADRRDGKPVTINLPVADLATALATAPQDIGVVIVVDNTHAPEWRNLWRIGRDISAARRDQAIAAARGKVAADALAYGERSRERSALFAYELARRFGEMCVARTILVSRALFTRRELIGWFRGDGIFEPEIIAAGLRAEGIEVRAEPGAVRAQLGELALSATATSLALDGDPAAGRLSPAEAKGLAERLSGPDIALALELVKRGQFEAMQLPEPAKPILDDLRRIILRHEAGTGARVQLELHYADKKVATVASAALGGLLALARTQAKDWPASLRDHLREVTVHSEGNIVRAELELETPLGVLIESALALAAR